MNGIEPRSRIHIEAPGSPAFYVRGTWGICLGLIVLTWLCLSPRVFAQDASGSNKNQMGVGQKVNVVAPASQSGTHSGANLDQIIETSDSNNFQYWEVKNSHPKGARFELFFDEFHESNNNNLRATEATNFQVDSDTCGCWSVTTSSSSIADDGDPGTKDGFLAAQSSGDGNATLKLKVWFVERDTPDQMAPKGTYTATFTGEITSNP